jgi:hypothetical protein
MTVLRRALSIGVMTLALGGLATPVAFAADTVSGSPAGIVAPARTWHATVQCQIIRISDNNAVGYERADGIGNSQQNAILDAQRNIPVPQGHYKRHCDTKRLY